MEAQRGQAASPNGSAEFVQRAGEASGPLNSFCPLADADGALRSLVWLQPIVLAKGNLLRKGRCLLLGDEPSILGRERRRGVGRRAWSTALSTAYLLASHNHQPL